MEINIEMSVLYCLYAVCYLAEVDFLLFFGFFSFNEFWLQQFANRTVCIQSMVYFNRDH